MHEDSNEYMYMYVHGMDRSAVLDLRRLVVATLASARATAVDSTGRYAYSNY